MRKLHVDFETRSRVDLKTAGVHKYATHRTTDILCTGWAFDDDSPELLEWDQIDEEVAEHVRDGGTVVAHNAQFEWHIWNFVGRRYGWPPLTVGQLDCTMVRAYAMGLPGSLDAVAAALGIEQRKDQAGYRKMRKLSEPRRTTPCENCFMTGGECSLCIEGEIDMWWNVVDNLQDYKDVYAYNLRDVEVEQAVDRRLMALSPAERRVWQIDQRINLRGVRVDLPLVEKAIAIVDTETKRLNATVAELTHHEVGTCNSHAAFKKWLIGHGVDTKGVAKDDVTQLLADPDLPPVIRSALEIRQEAAKSSTAKLRAISLGADTDGRLRGCFQYHAASTGRWSARRIQLHNMPRPSRKQPVIDEAFQYLAQYTPNTAREAIENFIGRPMSVISDCLRGFLVSTLGHDLVAGDFASIEGRGLAWLAGEESALQIYRTHGLVYEADAAAIHSVDLLDITKDDPRRQHGKVANLSMGYQGGVGAFQSMAKNYGVKLAPALRGLWAKANLDTREQVMKAWDERGKRSDIEKQEWIASELVKVNWRTTHPSIVAYWHKVEATAINAVLSGNVEVVDNNLPRVAFKKSGSFLFCKLPSGRCLTYAYPEIDSVETPWGVDRRALKYRCEDSVNRKWSRVTTYGGSLVENITQAVARDLLAHAMVSCEERGYPIVLHVHDEIVAEVPEGFGSVDEMTQIMTELPAWASGLPVAAEGWRGKRYRK